jgi:hypothetical protein
MRRALPLLFLAIALILPAAAHAQDSAQAKPKIKRNPDVISAEEIETASDAQDAYQVVKRLRPMWLTMRGGGSMNSRVADIAVYVNGVRMGGPDALRDIPRTGVVEMRFLRGTDATQRFGTGHESGAILVTPK